MAELNYNYVERHKVEQRAIDAFGVENQKVLCIEECGELITALAREPRNRSTPDDILSELADVFIMVEQMAKVYGEDRFVDWVDNKIKRLDERVAAIELADAEHIKHVDQNGIIR